LKKYLFHNCCIAKALQKAQKLVTFSMNAAGWGLVVNRARWLICRNEDASTKICGNRDFSI
jgi:hypothetical protein